MRAHGLPGKRAGRCYLKELPQTYGLLTLIT
jgi:hypothetical protein